MKFLLPIKNQFFKAPTIEIMKEKVLVLGSVAYDNIETRYAKEDNILGGSASYASLACSYFTQAAMLGVVGKDFNEKDMNLLKSRDIDLSALQVDNSGDTFFWSGKYLDNFNRRETLEVQLNVFEHFNPILPDSLKASKYVLLANISPALQNSCLEQLNSPEFVILDTMDLWINIAKPDLLNVMPKVDLFILNDSESELLTGEENIFIAAKKIVEMGAKSVLIKKGEHGSVLFSKDDMFIAPSYPVLELKDPTGAGDSYAGAMLGYIASKGNTDFETMKRAMYYASATASMTVEDFSCRQLEKLGMQEVENRVEKLIKISNL